MWLMFVSAVILGRHFGQVAAPRRPAPATLGLGLGHRVLPLAYQLRGAPFTLGEMTYVSASFV